MPCIAFGCPNQGTHLHVKETKDYQLVAAFCDQHEALMNETLRLDPELIEVVLKTTGQGYSPGMEPKP